MEKVLENIVSLVQQYPDGIPLKKLAVLYSQTYRKNLTLSNLGFDTMASLVASLDKDLVMNGDLVFHVDQRREVLENIVAMVKEQPAGIPVKKLAVSYSQTYHKNLTLSFLGVESMPELVVSLDRHLVMKGELVFHKDHMDVGSRTRAGGSAKATQDSKKIASVQENVVAMMKEHPDGVSLKKVAIAYSQKYHHNLTVASLGFKTMSCLVESLKKDLVVEGEVVFHKMHHPRNQRGGGMPAKATEGSRPSTPQRTETLPEKSSTTPSVPGLKVAPPPAVSFLGPSLFTSGSSFFCTPLLTVNPVLTGSKPAEKLSQDQLYQRVLEVSQTDKYADEYSAICILVVCQLA